MNIFIELDRNLATTKTPSMLAKCSCPVYKTSLSNLSGSRGSDNNLSIDPLASICSPAFPQSHPPIRRIHWPLSIMKSRPHICEEVVDMPDYDAKNLILRNSAVHTQTEAHQDPRKVRGGEDEQAEKAESSVGIPARPNIHEHTRQRRAQEGYRCRKRTQCK